MSNGANRLTAAEAAYVLGEPVKAVKRALDDGPVKARLVAKRGGAVRVVDQTDLLYLHAMRSLRRELTPKARKAFYRALKRAPAGAKEVRFGLLTIAIDGLAAELKDRTRELTNTAAKVEFREDGEPMLKGGTTEVHRIAALLGGGMTVKDICEDYPSLTPEDVETARAYAAAHPRAGKPYPSTTFKRAVKSLGLEALDDVLGDD